jgi:hypothetical protein
VAGHRAGAALLTGATANGQALFLVEPGNELVVGAPALAFEQLMQPAIAEATMLASKGTKPLTQSGVFLRPNRLATGERARDAHQPAGPPKSA